MDCNNIPSIHYGQFSAMLHSKTWSGINTLPLNGTLEVTVRCNLRCRHCYLPIAVRQGDENAKSDFPLSGCLPLPSSASFPTRSAMGFDEIRSYLDEIVEEGCLWLLITGGEPLVRSDFMDIYQYAKHKGLLISLFTNGTLVTDQIAAQLAEYPPFTIEVSLYGATANTYEAVTGVSGSFERCLRGIDLMQARGLPLQLKSMMLKANAHELVRIEELASQRGLPFRWDHQLHPCLDRSRDPVQVRLTPEEMVALDIADPRRIHSWRDLLQRTRHQRIGDPVFNCGAGIGSFHIDAFGHLQLCGFVRRYSYDLRSGSFHDGYHHYFPQVRSLKRSSVTDCNNCELTCLCGICVAWEDMEGNGREGPIDHIHRFAQLLAAAVTNTDCSVEDMRRGEEVLMASGNPADLAATPTPGEPKRVDSIRKVVI